MLPLFTQPYIITLLPSNEKSFLLNDWFGTSDLPWSFEPRNLCVEIFTIGFAVTLKMFYSIRLRGTKEEQGLATIGHLDIFSMFSGERQRKSRET